MTDTSATIDDHPSARPELRSRRPAEEREAQIIEAAFTAFAAHGLDETRLEDIARLAGVAKGTIYLYFPNKEALFREMIRRRMISRLDALENAARDHDPLTDLHRVVQTFWGFVNEPQFPVYYRLVISVLPQLPELSQFFAERVSLRWQRLLQTSIDACATAGVFDPVRAPESARMLHALIMQHALMRANTTLCAAMHIEDADALLDRILRFFFAALRPHSPTPVALDA